MRVDADDDQAVVDVAADAQAGERAGAEMVGGVAAAAETVGGDVGLADTGVARVEEAVGGGVELDAHRLAERLAVGAIDGEVGADGVAGDGRGEGVVAEAVADQVRREEEAWFEELAMQAGTRRRLTCPARGAAAARP